jgi:flavin-dependent dehydrogenase
MSTDFDIAVVGAGPAGSATARRLARCGCRVVLLERSRFGGPRVGESLAPATQPLLAELGVWSQFMALSPLPSYGTRSVWGSPDIQDHSHIISPYGRGWHVDRVAFDLMLAEAAVSAGAELRCGAALIGCDMADGNRWLLRLQEHGTNERIRLRARLLIDATGRAARLARRLGGERILLDRLVGVGTMFRDVDTSREGYILVESSCDGWWYTAPVPPDRMMAMLMTESDLCGRARLSDLGRWRGRLACAPATAARLVGTVLWGPRVFPAVSQRLRRNECDAPWIAVGDAALAVDPISGSGVVRALRSARAGAEAALSLLDGQTRHAIEPYEAERNRECTTYLHERAVYYGVEQRWRTFPFWQRRAAAVAQIGGV